MCPMALRTGTAKTNRGQWWIRLVPAVYLFLNRIVIVVLIRFVYISNDEIDQSRTAVTTTHTVMEEGK